MIGGIAANNASGMCCGTAQNSYQTLAGIRVVLADGTSLDTRDAGSRAAFAASRPRVRATRSTRWRARRADDAALAGAHPPQVPDEEHDRLQPERAGGLHRPDRHPRAPDDRLGGHARLHQRNHLPHGAGAPAQGERADPVRRPRHRLPRGDAPRSASPWTRSSWPTAPALRSVEDKPGLPAGIAARGARTARRCSWRRARADAAALAAQIASVRGGAGRHPDARADRASPPIPPNARAAGTCARACSRRWARCARRAPPSSSRTSRFPSTRLADATLDLQRLLRRARLPRGDHLRPRARRQPALRVHAGLQHARRGRAVPRVHGRAVPDGRRHATTARSRRSTAPAATWRRSSSWSGAPTPMR